MSIDSWPLQLIVVKLYWKYNDDTHTIRSSHTQQPSVRVRQFSVMAGKLGNVTGIILAKPDSAAKGGMALAIGSQLAIPVQLIGTREALDDLACFDPQTLWRR